MFWNSNIDEAILDYINIDFSASSAENVLRAWGFESWTERFLPGSATRLALVYSGTDYSFTAYELSWLENAKEVMSYTVSDDATVFFVDMSCTLREYYVCCAAIIKLLNVAVEGNNIFFFKMENAMAIGSSRLYGTDASNSFVVSGLITADNLYSYEELLENLIYCEIDDFPLLLMDFSPQEKDNSRDYDSVGRSIEYLDAVSELRKQYETEDPDRIRFTCRDSMEKYDVDSYKATSNELKSVGEKITDSSYEDLEDAVKAEEIAAQKQVIFNDDLSADGDGETVEGMYSSEAFENAEIMLKEMLDKDN